MTWQSIIAALIGALIALALAIYNDRHSRESIETRRREADIERWLKSQRIGRYK